MKNDDVEKLLKKYPSMREPFNALGPFFVDPLGSYTGIAVDPEETPVQDADDL